MVAGYERRSQSAAIYFREMYALMRNVNRGEKDEAITGADVLPLPGDKPTRGRKSTSRNVQGQRVVARSDEELADIMRRINTPPVPSIPVTQES